MVKYWKQKLKPLGHFCFYCNVDSDELRMFVVLVIGGLILCTVFCGIGLYFRGYFKNTENLSDYPLKVEGGISFEREQRKQS